MKKENIFSLEGMDFPSGRKTRVMIGSNGAIDGKHFCQGYVVLSPGGSVPPHEHAAEETYTILSGEGEMTVDGETAMVGLGDFVLIPPHQLHGLRNTGSSEMEMMFVFAPPLVADHWGQEMNGTLPKKE